MLREPWLWDESDILSLVGEQRAEDLQLEYKKSEALSKSEQKKKSEISKDVSAMANSAGGVIIYGIDEQEKSGGPVKLDEGIDATDVSREWLEQVIDSGVQRRIAGLRVHMVRMSTGRFVYVVSVPQSQLAPHMAADHRYYKRLGTTTAMMEEYEVRDVGRRSESPDLYLLLNAIDAGMNGMIHLKPRIGNRSAEPVLYATFRIYVEEVLNAVPEPYWQWSNVGRAELLWNDRDKMTFHTLRRLWSVPSNHPILEGEEYALDPVQISAGTDFKMWPERRMYNIGWELRAPKAPPKIQGVKLIVSRDGPEIQGSYPLAPA